MVDVDLYKAYDTVDRWVKEMALRRLGLEYEFIDYLLEFDRRNVQQVQTAYGPSAEFSCDCHRRRCSCATASDAGATAPAAAAPL